MKSPSVLSLSFTRNGTQFLINDSFTPMPSIVASSIFEDGITTLKRVSLFGLLCTEMRPSNSSTKDLQKDRPIPPPLTLPF